MQLTAAHRNKLAPQTFGLPSQRKYPMPDASHAENAKARAAEMLHAGKLSQSEYDQIIAMANTKLGGK